MLPLFIKAGIDAYGGEHVIFFAHRLLAHAEWQEGVVVGIHNDAAMFVIPGMDRDDVVRQWEVVHDRAALSASYRDAKVQP